MDETEKLLRQFTTEGLSAIRSLKEQNDAISKDMTDLKVAISTIREQIVSLNQSFKQRQERLEKEADDLAEKVVQNQKQINTLEKNIVEIQTTHQNVKDKADQQSEVVTRVAEEMTEVEKRLGEVEDQQSKWMGAITVVGVVIGFVLALARGWIASILGIKP